MIKDKIASSSIKYLFSRQKICPIINPFPKYRAQNDTYIEKTSWKVRKVVCIQQVRFICIVKAPQNEMLHRVTFVLHLRVYPTDD